MEETFSLGSVKIITNKPSKRKNRKERAIMPASMGGPFAEKLKAVTKGREFPKASPDALTAAEGLDLSGDGKSGREKRRPNKRAVKGRDVHVRIAPQSPSRELILSPETPLIDLNEEQAEAERVQRERREILEQALVETLKPMTELSEKVISVHDDFSTFVRLADLKTDPTIEIESGDGKKSVSIRVLMQELFDEASALAETYQKNAAELGQAGYERTLNQFRVILDEMEELFQAFREAVDTERKSGAGSPSNDETRPDGPHPTPPSNEKQESGDGPSLHETIENAHFKEGLASLETSIGEWLTIRQELLGLIGDRQYERFITESGSVGALARGKVLKEVKTRITEYYQALERGEVLGDEAKDWLDHHVQGMRGIIAIGGALRDRIQRERIADPTQVKQAVSSKSEGGSETAGAGKTRPSNEKRPYVSFNADELHALWRKQGALERIDMVASQLKEWRTFDQAIQKFKDVDHFKDDLKARGLGDRYDQVLRLTGRGEAIATRLEEIRKAFEEKGELDQKEAAFLTAIFFDYHELLAVAESIVAERERETPIVEAEKKERELVAFLDNNYRRIIRSLKGVKTQEQFDTLNAENADYPISGGKIDIEAMRHLFGDQYPENDDRLVERLLRLANKFQVEIDALYKEVEQKVSAKAEKAVLVADPENVSEKKSSFQEKVARLRDLLAEWKALEQEFGDDKLWQAIRNLRKLEKRGGVPPTNKIANWFADHKGPKAWQGRTAAADRALLTDDALPGMEGMVRDALVVAEKLREERAETVAAQRIKETVVEKGTPKPPPSAEVIQMETEKKKRELSRRINIDEINDFNRRMRDVLERGKVSEDVWQSAVREEFEYYMPRRIRQITQELAILLTEQEIEVLLESVRKNLLVVRTNR